MESLDVCFKLPNKIKRIKKDRRCVIINRKCVIIINLDY